MSTKPLVLITGATGHLGFATLLDALKNGYRARLSVRQPEQEQKLRNNSHLKPYDAEIEFVVVPNITKPGAFDEAVKNVDYIIHCASPIPKKTVQYNDWKSEMIEPAVAGATGILESASKEPKVKRVVFTSSMVVLDFTTGELPSPKRISPAPTAEEIESLKDSWSAYLASKKASHNATISFMKHTKPNFSLVRILPAYVQGANLLNTHSSQAGQGSNDIMMELVLGQRKNLEVPATAILVHIDDTAHAHILALDENKAKDGEDFVILANGGKSIEWSDVHEIVARNFPEEVKSGLLPGKQAQKPMVGACDVSATVGTPGLGMGELLGLEEMVKSNVGYYLTLKKQELANGEQ